MSMSLSLIVVKFLANEIASERRDSVMDVAVFLFFVFLLKGGNNNSDVTHPKNTEDSQVDDGVAAVSMFISPYILFVSLYFSLVYFSLIG